MLIPLKPYYITPEEYLANEHHSEIKHEYIDGSIYPIVNKNRQHNIVITNLAASLKTHLENTNCEVYRENVKLCVNPVLFYYPDVLVTCEVNKEDDDYIIKFPCLIIEVLSPSTASVDKREKLIAYKMIESLQEYAIVWQDEMRIELHRRNNEGWLTFFFTQPEDEIEFASVKLKTTTAEIYRGVTFEQ
jgi:Uma2 family endonuclease